VLVFACGTEPAPPKNCVAANLPADCCEPSCINGAWVCGSTCQKADAASDVEVDAAIDSPADTSMDAGNDVLLVDAQPDVKLDAPKNDSGLLCPTPANVMNFMPPAFVPPNAPKNVCLQAQTQGYWDNCRDPGTATIQKCTAWGMANMSCATCIESSRNDPSWGPLVIGNGVLHLNVAGCVALRGDLPCARAIEKLDACNQAACDMQCPVVDTQSFMDWQKCVATATATGCKSYDDDVKMTCVADTGTAYTICRNYNDFKTGYFLYGPMFCGSGG